MLGDNGVARHAKTGTEGRDASVESDDPQGVAQRSDV
jgi:hypothetical protein